MRQGRAFGIVESGRVIFKSDIGAASGSAAQIQGVWLDPALRGRGLSEPAMAGVTEYVLADYPVACLYVNDFNTRAIRCYEKAGFIADHDHRISDELRFVQLTPPGSACSIAIGTGKPIVPLNRSLSTRFEVATGEVSDSP